MFVDALKGQIQARLECSTKPLKAILSTSINYHKTRNNKALRAVWCALWHAME